MYTTDLSGKDKKKSEPTPLAQEDPALLTAFEAQVAFAGEHPAAESQVALRRRRAVFGTAVDHVAAQIETAAAAVAAATTALGKTRH